MKADLARDLYFVFLVEVVLSPLVDHPQVHRGAVVPELLWIRRTAVVGVLVHLVRAVLQRLVLAGRAVHYVAVTGHNTSTALAQLMLEKGPSCKHMKNYHRIMEYKNFDHRDAVFRNAHRRQ